MIRKCFSFTKGFGGVRASEESRKILGEKRERVIDVKVFCENIGS